MRRRGFRHSRDALENARLALERCRAARSFDEFDENWRMWLRDVQRVWNKLEAVASEPRFQSLRNRHQHLERTDPLLKYIKIARDSDEHSVRDVSHEMFDLELTPTDIFGHENVFFSKTRYATPVLWPVQNRGAKADPPTSHLGTPIGSADAFRVAELAMQYFEDLIARAEATL